jgi:ribonuclease D
MTPDYMNHDNRARVALPPATIIDQPVKLGLLQQALSSSKRIAIDTESNSLHAYHERVCLIQISTMDQDYLLDPIKLGDHVDLGFLGDIFANPQIEKVLHAAEYDVLTMRRDFGFQFANLFDTMIAARILGWERVGLAPLLEERFGIKADKRHQRANWGKRPLTHEMIQYAQSDTHYLLALRDEIATGLSVGGHMEEARELFDEVALSQWAENGDDTPGFWWMNGVKDLDAQQLAVLEALYEFREEQARKRDLPVFKILSDKVLVQLAIDQPLNSRSLETVQGMTRGLIGRYSHGIIGAVKVGQQAMPPTRPRNRTVVDDAAQQRYEMLHMWRKKKAAIRGVSSEVIMPRDTLWKLAHSVPASYADLRASSIMGPWRLKTYGQELVDVLASNPEKGTS